MESKCGRGYLISSTSFTSRLVLLPRHASTPWSHYSMTARAAKYLSTISFDSLKAHLASNPTPLHIGSSLTTHWPARSTWRLSDDLAAIRTTGEDKEVEIEVGKRRRGYMDPEFQRIHMGLGEST